MNKSLIFIVLFLSTLLVACSDSPEEQAREQHARSVKLSQQLIEESLARFEEDRRTTSAHGAGPAGAEVLATAHSVSDIDAAQGQRVRSVELLEPVPYTELFVFFPEIEGWTRGAPGGEISRVADPNGKGAGKHHSEAAVTYRRGSARITVEVTDQAMRQLSPRSSNLTTEFNRPGEGGFERSTVIAGQPATESWQARYGKAVLRVEIADRFDVEVKSREAASFAEVRAVTDALNYSQLEEWAKDAKPLSLTQN